MSIRIRSELPRLYALLAVCMLLLAWSRPSFAADDLEAYRERFKVGYEKYMARDFAGAIVEWEAIYRELGAERGYRLAFNLARAYDAYGDTTRAAEAYESYLGEVAKKKDGPPLEPIVLKQADDAEERLKELAKTRGRVKVRTQGRAIVVQVDSGEPRVSGFTAYVTPGAHTITWNPGTAEERKVEVNVAEGALEVIDPPPAPKPVPVPEPGANSGGTTPPPRTETVIERPFPAWPLYVGAGVTVASVAVPIAYYVKGYDQLTQERKAAAQGIDTRDAYSGAQNDYSLSWIVPSALAAVTLGATAYYFFGSKEKTVTITPTASVTKDAANAAVVGRF